MYRSLQPQVGGICYLSSSSRHCSGELISPQGNKYLICNPPDTIPCCSKLVGALAGEVSADDKQCPAGC